jgi:curved DNA-binding protein CbpA
MARPVRNYYQLLGVSPEASAEEIHRAYRKLARRYHPDVNAGGDADARFQALSDAYDVLHDPDQRARYDRLIGRGRAAAAPQARFVSAARSHGGPPRFVDAPVKDGVPSFSPDRSRRDVPFFSPARSRRDVPRFTDERPAAPRPLRRPVLQLQFVVRWLR